MAGRLAGFRQGFRQAFPQGFPPPVRPENLSLLHSLAHFPRPAFEEAWSRPLPAEVDSRGGPTLCVLGGIQRNERFCLPRKPLCLFGLCTVRIRRTPRPAGPSDQPPRINPPVINAGLDAAHRPRLQQPSPYICRRVALEQQGGCGHNSFVSNYGRFASHAVGSDPAAAAVATGRHCFDAFDSLGRKARRAGSGQEQRQDPGQEPRHDCGHDCGQECDEHGQLHVAVADLLDDPPRSYAKNPPAGKDSRRLDSAGEHDCRQPREPCTSSAQHQPSDHQRRPLRSGVWASGLLRERRRRTGCPGRSHAPPLTTAAVRAAAVSDGEGTVGRGLR